MPHLIPLVVVCCGLALGGWIARRCCRGDSLAHLGWLVAGAVPGAALMVGEPYYILGLVVVLPLLLLRHHQRKDSRSTA